MKARTRADADRIRFRGLMLFAIAVCAFAAAIAAGQLDWPTLVHDAAFAVGGVVTVLGTQARYYARGWSDRDDLGR